MAKKKPVKKPVKKAALPAKAQEAIDTQDRLAATLKDAGVILSSVGWDHTEHCFRFCVDAQSKSKNRGSRHISTIKLKVRNDGTYKLLIEPTDWLRAAATKAGFRLDPVEKPAKKTAKKVTKKAPRAQTPEGDAPALIMPEEGRTSIPFPTDRG